MSTAENDLVQGIRTEYKYGFSNPDEAKDYFFKSGRGLSHELVDAISAHKSEPEWMRAFRHKSLDYFNARPMPTWGGMPSLHEIDFENIFYYIKPDFVHVFVGGKIVEEGGSELAEKLEVSGYEQWEVKEEVSV